MKTMAVEEVNSAPTDVVEQVETTKEKVVITRDGQPVAVLMTYDEFESIELTIEVLSDPNFLSDLAEAKADIAAGRVMTIDEVRAHLGLQ